MSIVKQDSSTIDTLKRYAGKLIKSINIPNTSMNIGSLFSNDDEEDTLKQRFGIALSEVVKDRKLIILIDELDRCNPAFAVRVLEMVKHFLNIDNVIFIFAIDETQLCKTLKYHYGDIDARKYLERFFDFTFKIPYQSPEFFAALIKDYCDNRKKNNVSPLVNLEKMLLQTGEEYKNLNILSLFDITPRDVIRICRSMDVVLKGLSENAKWELRHTTSEEFQKAQYVHEIDVFLGFVVLYHVLYQSHTELYDYITDDRNWSSDELSRVTISRYCSEFLNRINKIASDNPNVRAWISDLNADAVIFIIFMYKLKHMNKRQTQEKQKLGIVELFQNVISKEVQNMLEDVKKRLNRGASNNYKANCILGLYVCVLESCISEGDHLIAGEAPSST